MGKKNRKKKDRVELNSSSDVKNNPFAGLDFSAVTTPEPEPVVEEVEEVVEDKGPQLSPADQALLEAFGEKGIEFSEVDAEVLCRKKLYMRIEKKKRAGHPVTVVRGFDSDNAEYMMELIGTIKQQLGVGGKLRDDVLELQGNQLSRLPDILLELGYEAING